MNDDDELSESEQNELMRRAWASNQDNPDYVPEESAVEAVEETVKVEAKESQEKPVEVKKQDEKQDGQTIRVVVEQPKKKKKKENSFEEGLTDEEKAEWKRTRLEEKRVTIAERKLRLTQRKRNVEDDQFREVINPNQVGVYRRAKIVAQAVAPSRPVQVRAEARASSRGFTAGEMVGRVKSVRENAPFNPVVASSGNRADYFRGYRGSRAKAGNPVVSTQGFHANYYSKPVSNNFSFNRFRRGVAKNVKFKSRWSK